MAFPIAAVAGRGLLEVGKYLAAAGIPGIGFGLLAQPKDCLLYTSPSPRDRQKSRMPSSA